MDSLYDMNDTRKIGVALCAFGAFFSTLGVMMFLDSALLTLGNLLFVSGVCLVMGVARCKAFFLDRSRMRASGCFFFGILLVMRGWCFVGLLLQGFGGLNLFGNFFPMVVRVLEAAPLVGPLLQHPQVQRLLAAFNCGGANRSV
jgi:hypothetical protein